MFQKSSMFKINDNSKQISDKLSQIKLNSNQNNLTSGNLNSNFKIDEINFDEFLEEPVKNTAIKTFVSLNNTLTKPFGSINNTTTNKLVLTKSEVKRTTFFDEFSIKNEHPFYVPSIKVTETPLFSSIKPVIKLYKTLSKYIPQISVDVFTKWNKNIRKRPNSDIDNLLNKDNFEPVIKKLQPNKSFDIIPKYLKKRSTRKNKNNEIDSTLLSTYSCKAVSKAYKVCRTDKQPIINVTIIGPHRSGKSTLLGSILSKFEVFNTTFIKKTAWEATKAGSPSRQKAWLVDSSLYERSSDETIISSSYVFENEKKILRLSDTPGNDAYFIEQTLQTLLTSNIVMITIDCKSFNEEYLHKMCILLKIFSIHKVIIILTNIFNESDYKETRVKIIKICKRYGSKLKPHFTKIEDIKEVKSCEITSIMSIIDTFEVDVDELSMLSPLILEVQSIYKPVESVSPVIVGEVITGGISAGLNNAQSKAVIIPGNLACTVKAMKIEEKDGTMKTRSFAFPGDIVELSLSEITSTENVTVRRGDVLCHPQNILPVFNEFTIKLIMIPRENNHVPIIKGSSVFLWSRTKSCFATITKIISVEYINECDNSIITKKSPRLIVEGTKSATVTVITDKPIPLQHNSQHKLDILLLFQHSQLFAAGKFIIEN